MTRLLLPFFLILSTSDARSLATSPENDRVPKTGGGIAMNIEVGSQMNTKEPGKLSDERNMLASGSFPVKIVGGEEKRFENGNVLPVAPSWRPINRHFNRMRLIRRTFPANCRHRGSRFEDGAEIQPQRSPEREIVEDNNLRKFVSAGWSDGKSLHRLDAITFPAIDGDDLMIGELENPRFIFHRHHNEEKDQITIHKCHALWKKIRNFLANF